MEIPKIYGRVNQLSVVILFLLAVVTQQFWIVVVIWATQVINLFSGGKGNPIVLLVKPLLRKRLNSPVTEAIELVRFNGTIAVALDTLAMICFYLLGWTTVGFVFVGIHALAAFVALCGFCVGCFIYFQYKQWRFRKSV